jgi:ERCC4-type nuclease
MILVDDRAGSRELAPLLPKAKTQLTRLDFGDVMFLGSGPQGDVVIGIEHKTVGDVLSCIMDGRFAAHQLPGLKDSYHYSYLMVEGRTRQDKHGLLWWFHEAKRKWIQPQGGSQRKPLSMEAWDQWLNSMAIQGGITVIHTETKKQSAARIKTLARWWAKSWDKHSSLKVFNEASRITAPLTKVSTRRLIAAQLPGVGWERSAAISRHFPTVLDMCLATPKDWEAIPGVGKKLAQSITEELNGGG